MREPIADAEDLDNAVQIALVTLSVIEHDGQQDIFPRGQLTHEVIALEHEAEAAAAQHGELVIAVFIELLVLIIDLAGRGGIQPAKQV